MTPHTAALTCRVLIRAAASYTQFIGETDPIKVKLWEDDYKTGDIEQWARDRIANILERCSDLQPLFADDDELCSSVQNAAVSSLEALEWTGCLSGNAATPGVGTMRIDE